MAPTDMFRRPPRRIVLASAATIALTAAIFVLPAKAAEPDLMGVVSTYADIGLATYEDALTTAKALDKAVDALIANPSQETMDAARKAWKVARDPYQQSESIVSAIPSSTTGKVASTPGRWTRG